MQLNLLTQIATVRRFAAAAQATTATVLDFTIGSVWRAMAEAVTSVGLWLQWLILLVLQTTRLSTSTGTDVDSFVGDWTLTRLPAVAATGTVTLSRYSATQPALVLPGVQIKTTDGSQIFTVTTDTTNAAWSATSLGYVVAAGTASVTVPVQAAVAGSAGNILPGTLTLMATGVAGIDYATNSAAFTNGADAETDAALKARFQLFILGLRAGTDAAIGAAVVSVQQGLTYTIVDGAPGAGSSTVYVDDGSGAPPSNLLASVFAAVDAVRASGITLYVMAVQVVGVSVNAVLSYNAGAVQPDVIANVQTAIAAYAATLAFGQTLSIGRMYQVILGADPGVADITTLTLNGGAVSVTAAAYQRCRITTSTVA